MTWLLLKDDVVSKLLNEIIEEEPLFNRRDDIGRRQKNIKNENLIAPSQFIFVFSFILS